MYRARIENLIRAVEQYKTKLGEIGNPIVRQSLTALLELTEEELRDHRKNWSLFARVALKR
jgi:hypothetical protein